MYYQIYKDVTGDWRWRLKAANHEIVAISSEGYAQKSSAEHSINLTKSSYNAPVK